MRVSLFGLFLRGTSLMGSWPKLVQSDLFGFIDFYRFYVSLGDIWCFPIYFTSHLFTCSYLTIPWALPAGYHLLYIYLPIHAYAHDTVFSAWLWFGFIDTLVLILARHLALVSLLAWGVSSDSPGSSCPGHGAWSVWFPPVADQSGATVAWISSRPPRALFFRAPCVPLEFSFL